MLEILIRILILLFMLFFGVSEEQEVPMGTVPDTGEVATVSRMPILIDDVTVNVMESFPMQISLDITGSIQDGCDFPVVIKELIGENTITVNIYREIPGEVFCPMVIQPYSETIVLNGTFESGQYTIVVNDQVIEVEL